jgi:hypothetical protein
MAAAADRDRGAAAKAKLLAFPIHDFKITLDANGTVSENRHSSACHMLLRKMTCQSCRAMSFHDSGARGEKQERKVAEKLEIGLSCGKLCS